MTAEQLINTLDPRDFVFVTLFCTWIFFCNLVFPTRGSSNSYLACFTQFG